jgi:hypothetical protein
MSRDILVNVQRVNASAPFLTNIAVQLDNREMSEVLYYEGVAPVERFDAYVYGIYDNIRQTDLLIDTINIDSVTSTNYKYRIINISEPFPDYHMELIVDLFRQ